MSQGHPVVAVVTAHSFQESQAQLPGGHLQGNFLRLRQAAHIPVAAMKRHFQVTGQTDHKTGLLQGDLPPQTMVEVGHPQVQSPLRANSSEQVQESHGVGPPGNRHHDPVTRFEQIFIENKAAHRREQEGGVGRDQTGARSPGFGVTQLGHRL